MAEEGFLRRWARLKAEPEAEPAPAPAPLPAPVAEPAPLAPVRPDVVEEQAPPLTLADAAALTPDADFSGFVAKNVDAAVRRLAMKKLFADPHFHGHDGLDIYMGDYSLASPVSEAMLADMTHNKSLFANVDAALAKVEALLAEPGDAAGFADAVESAAAGSVAAPVLAVQAVDAEAASDTAVTKPVLAVESGDADGSAVASVASPTAAVESGQAPPPARTLEHPPSMPPILIVKSNERD